MIAPNLVVTALITEDTACAALTTTAGNTPRVYSPRLMPGWKPSVGAAIVHSVRGGPSPSLHTPIIKPSIQVTTWAATPKQARTAQSAVYDVLHGVPQQIVSTPDGDVIVLWGKAETFPQDVVDPETGWFTVTCFYELALTALIGE